MKVINYTDKIRYMVLDMFMPCMNQENGLEAAEEKYDDLENDDHFETYISAMFICSYLYTNIFYKLNPDDEDAKDDFEFYESFDTMEEFVDAMDFEQFLILYADTEDFMKDSYYEKRDYIMRLDDKGKKLRQLCPIFISDIFYYKNTYNTEELMDCYFRNLAVSGKEELALEDTISSNVDDLNTLGENDIDNYKYIICELIVDFYKYNKYLISNGEKIDEEEMYILDYIEKNMDELIILTYGNDVILEALIRGFLNYNTLDINKQDAIDIYYSDKENKEKLNKVKVKSIKLKGEIK